MKERQSQTSAAPEYVQTSFLAPEQAVWQAEMTRLRLIFEDLAQRYNLGLSREPEGAGYYIRCPQDVYRLLREQMGPLPYEEFRVLVLTSKNEVRDVVTLYKGTLNSSPVRVAEVFRPAIVGNGASIIAVHCHPSGDPTPSPEDVRATSEIVKAGELLGIEVIDHVIIGRDRYVSLKERGLGFG